MRGSLREKCHSTGVHHRALDHGIQEHDARRYLSALLRTAEKARRQRSQGRQPKGRSQERLLVAGSAEAKSGRMYVAAICDREPSGYGDVIYPETYYWSLLVQVLLDDSESISRVKG